MELFFVNKCKGDAPLSPLSARTNKSRILSTATWALTMMAMAWGSSIKGHLNKVNKDNETKALVAVNSFPAVTKVKNEGDQCGASPYFSTTGALEGGYAIATGNLVSLSKQQLISCDDQNDGCNGGFMTNSYEYILNSGGIESEASYPYTGTSSNCVSNSSDYLVSIYGYQNVTYDSELALQYAVATIGPISAAFYFLGPSYNGGVYYNPNCPPNQASTGVLIVGYGIWNSTLDYWIGKLSFGESFGINGYIYLARNKNNNCGIASFASYPTGVHKYKSKK